jgi:hypothetical protein
MLRVVPWCFALGLTAASTMMADLQPKTVEAFDRYVRVTEARMAKELEPSGSFLLLDSLPEPRRKSAIDEVRGGGLFIERLATSENGHKLEAPDALIHHWVGAVFVPGATVDRAVALMQDYDRHADVFRPAVARAKILSKNGDDFRVALRFSLKKVITVVVNTENDAHFSRPRPDRAYSRIISTRIAQVDNPGTAEEKEQPVGHDGGYLWRLNSYWRYLERDGGTYIQCETISLTRDIPFMVSWIVKPFVTSIPRESLTFTLEKARGALATVPRP